MQIIDIIISILLAVGLFLGLRDGIVKQIATLVGLVVGLLVGKLCYTPVGDWLTGLFGMSSQVSRIVAFALIMVVVPLLFTLLGWLISKLLSAVSLGWLNRLLGGLVGVLKFSLFVGILITGVELFDVKDRVIAQPKKNASYFYYPIYKASSIFFDGVKGYVKK